MWKMAPLSLSVLEFGLCIKLGLIYLSRYDDAH